jgi:pimeloyl-ACP methyl ester carboxylesterase
VDVDEGSAKRYGLRMGLPPRLHHTLVRSDAPPQNKDVGASEQGLLFLHGILGSGANLRSLALQLVQRVPGLVVALVDLRGHGRSEHGSAPHTVAQCAADLSELERSLEFEVAGVVGHSFGGKVALAFHALRPALARVVLLDSAPFARPERAGSEQTMAIIALLERAPPNFATRAEFLAFVQQDGHSRAIADWLAMNLTREGSGFRLRLDLAQIRALLDDYFTLDLWPVVERCAAQVDMLIAGRSEVYAPSDITSAESLSRASAGRVHVHHLPEAGHWLHVDDPEAVLRVLTEH